MQQTTNTGRTVVLRTKRDFARYHEHRARERRAEHGNGRFTPPVGYTPKS